MFGTPVRIGHTREASAVPSSDSPPIYFDPHTYGPRGAKSRDLQAVDTPILATHICILRSPHELFLGRTALRSSPGQYDPSTPASLVHVHTRICRVRFFIAPETSPKCRQRCNPAHRQDRNVRPPLKRSNFGSSGIRVLRGRKLRSCDSLTRAQTNGAAPFRPRRRCGPQG